MTDNEAKKVELNTLADLIKLSDNQLLELKRQMVLWHLSPARSNGIRLYTSLKLMVQLYLHQTSEEVVMATTKESNGIGFASGDAEWFTKTVEALLDGGSAESFLKLPKAQALEMAEYSRLTPRWMQAVLSSKSIAKYARQYARTIPSEALLKFSVLKARTEAAEAQAIENEKVQSPTLVEGRATKVQSPALVEGFVTVEF